MGNCREFGSVVRADGGADVPGGVWIGDHSPAGLFHNLALTAPGAGISRHYTDAPARYRILRYIPVISA